MKLHHEQHGPRNEVLRIKSVAQRTGLGRSTIFELLRQDSPKYDPQFPKPFPLSTRARGFLASEVDAWIELKAAKRSCKELSHE